MELRDLGEIDFYSIFSLLCRSESKMFRAHFPLHIPCIVSYPCVELFKIHPMPLLPSYILTFAPPCKNASMGPTKDAARTSNLTATMRRQMCFYFA